MAIFFLTKEEYHKYRKEHKRDRISFECNREFQKRSCVTSIQSYYVINGHMFYLAKFGYLPGPNFTTRSRYTLSKVY